MESLREQRKRDIIDTINFREPKKVPVGIDAVGWAFSYDGARLEDLDNDPEAACKAYTKFFDEVPLDFVSSTWLSAADVRTNRALGCYDYTYASDGNAVTHNQAAANFMSAEDYEELIKDPDAFREKLMKKRMHVFSEPREIAYEALKKAARTNKTCFDISGLISQYLTEEKQIYGIYDESPEMFYAPFDVIFDTYRGIRNALTDLRRRPDVVREACAAIRKSQLAQMTVTPDECTDPLPVFNTIYHSECFLSPQQYDELFFQPFKDTYLPFMEKGKRCYLLGEGSFLNTLDRFRELPKGAMMILLDEDDPFEAYKKIGDWATLICGINLNLLKLGTKEQCIDYVKKCFDTFAPGGGFMFSPNREMVSSQDAKIENVVAVFEAADRLSRGEN